jgi:hypothetical protein
MSTSTIKIKVKHLFLIIVLIPVLLFVLPYGYLFYADKISEKNPTAAISMYKKYIAAPPFVMKKDNALFSLALKSFYAKGGSYYEKLYTDGSSINSSYISKEMLDNAVSLYNDILKDYKNSNYYTKAYNNLLYIYTYSANTKAGLELIRQGEASDKKLVRLTAAMYKLYYKLTDKQYAEVLILGKELVKEYGENRGLYKLMAEASLFSKDYNSAISYYNKAKLSLAPKYDETVYNLIPDNIYDEQIAFVNDLKENSDKNTSVNGRVSILGKGVPFARVYLKEIGDLCMSSGEDDALTFGITDFNGNYTIKHAPVGNYKLMLVIPGFLLNDSVLSEENASNITLDEATSLEYNFNFVKPLKIKTGHHLKPDKGNIKLSWDPVSGAAYYIVDAILFSNPLKPDGNSTCIQISEEITADNYKFDLASVNSKVVGYSISDDGKLDPQAYLGTLYQGCSVPVYVNAYDKRGLKMTSSMTKIVLYDKLPVIKLSKEDFNEAVGLPKSAANSQGEGLARAERLILERKPEQAEKILSEELKKNPDNMRIMNILSNIYTRGTRRIIKSGKPDEVIIGQNLNRAIELNDKLYALTKNVEYIRKNNYIYEYDLKDYKSLIRNYERITEEKFTGFDYDNRGDVKIKLGKFEEAEKDFGKMYKAFQYNEATNLNPILLDLYNKNFKAALTAIEETNLRLYKVSVVQLKKDIGELQGTSVQNGEYESFKKILGLIMMKKSNCTKQSEYKNLIEKIKAPHLNSIINQALSYYSVYQ